MTASPTAPWRLLPGSAPADGPTHMALDAALLASVRAGAPPALRLYRWDPPTLSFGRNQPARHLYDEAAARARGIAFVRRPTGGQAVLHADELTYAVVAPVEVIGRPRAAYRRINEALVAGLRQLGLPAAVATVRETAAAAGGAAGDGLVDAPGNRPGSEPGAGARRGPGFDWAEACFARPEPGEVVVAGRKLVGSAQRCEGRVVLQHGSILISGSQAPAEELLLRATVEGATSVGRSAGGAAAGGGARGGWTTLSHELGERPDRSALEAAVVAGFETVFGIALAPATESAEERTRARALRGHYASRKWTWRR